MSNYTFTPAGVRDCIVDKLAKNSGIFFNELDLQMFVARALESEFNIGSGNNGFRVYLEYCLPKGWNHNFDADYSRWGEIPYFDIVLEDTEQTQFIVIELKYKLKKIQNSNCIKSFNRFANTSATSGITLLKKQGAGNEARYDFWKDVKRLELLTKHFGTVIGGVALFYTNENSYTNCNTGNKYSKFNFTPTKNGFLYWDYSNHKICTQGCKCGDPVCETIPCGERLKKKVNNNNNCGSQWVHFKRPNFTLNGNYTGIWCGIKDANNKTYLNTCLGQNFYCYSVLIPSKYSQSGTTINEAQIRGSVKRSQEENNL